jgi:hypothetical protein
MAQKSKTTRSHIQNLSKASRKPTVEEVDDEEPLTPVCHAQVLVTKSDLELIDVITQLNIKMFPDLDDDDDDDDDGDDGLNREDDTKIKELSKLEAFTAALQQAQAIATAVEQEREKGKKRPKRYAGNLARTKSWHVQKAREYEMKGYPSISKWFGLKKGVENPQEKTIQPNPELLSSDEIFKVEVVEAVQGSIQNASETVSPADLNQTGCTNKCYRTISPQRMQT